MAALGDSRRAPAYDVVVPTVGRATLARLLAALADGPGPLPERVVLVDDRRDPGSPLVAAGGGLAVEVVRGPARGPAAARNAGWRACAAEWVAFLDDDVVPGAGWRAALARDLARAGERVGASQGRIRVPLPAGRRPTDWERNVSGLEEARWATADMAYRRAALVAVGGFDERFPRAYREDADLGLRVVAAGWRIERGERSTLHPPGAAPPWVSVRLQAGNADDPLMRRLHGRDWRARAGVPRGRLPRHAATSAAGALALAGALAGRRRVATAGAAGWLAGVGELAWARIAPGPRTPREVATMVATSAALPLAATWHRLRGELRAPLLARRPGPAAAGRAGAAARAGAAPAASGAPAAAASPAAAAASPAAPLPDAVLLDRDGTLVVDVPYNADPARVAPVPGARAALDRLRAAGVRLAVVSNQSGIGRGLIDASDVERVNARVEELLGPLGPFAVCPHAPGAGCACRKPAPGLVLEAARALGVAPERCVVIGDIGADVEAAAAAGARAILVPNERTLPAEVAAAPAVAPSLGAAVDRLLGTAPLLPGAEPTPRRRHGPVLAAPTVEPAEAA